MNRHAVVAFALGTLVIALATGPRRASADSADSTASPQPSPTPTARPLGFREASRFSFSFIDSATNGPGQVGPEAVLPPPNFTTGSPLSPNTPYDLFNSAPQVPGVTGVAQIVSNLSYGLRRFDLGLTLGAGVVRGSVTNAAYWSDNLLPTLNPHLGSQALPYSIAFPSHAGQDDGTGVRVSVLGGSVATADGNLRLRVGWFDLAQTERFVFTQPMITSVPPAIAYAPAESLGGGVANADFWDISPSVLPLHGADLVARHGLATLELTSAALPSLPGEDARVSLGSLVIDHGEGTRYAVEVVHAKTSGTPFMTTVPFGGDPTFLSTPQGILPTSTLSGQRQTIAGLSAEFHLIPALGIDAIAQLGRASYDASPIARPGTSAPGRYYHVGLSHTHGRATASVDYYSMGPRYATIILPYGVPENQWSAAFAWPGQWLKSNYQLIDNSVLGVNRQGYRLRYSLNGGPFEIRTEFTDLHQLEPETRDTATQDGFLDGFYLPQFNDAPTFGRQKRYGLWAAWHSRAGDLTLDVVDDTLERPFVPSHPEDNVSYEVPQAMLTFSHQFSKRTLATVGTGRYALKGTFSEPLDFAQRLFFAGVQLEQSPNASVLVSLRRTVSSGITTYPLFPNSPNYTGTMLIVEQRVSF